MVSGGVDWDELAEEGWTLSASEMEDLARGVLPAAFRDDEREAREREREREAREREMNRVRGEMGMGVHVDKLKKTETVTVRISQVAFQGLMMVAEREGLWHQGHGNISALIEAIGQGKLTVQGHTETG